MKSNDSPEASSRIPRGVFWPLKYVWRAAKKRPMIAVALYVFPLIAALLTSGFFEMILPWCVSIVPLLLLTISGMRIAAAEVAPERKLEEHTRTGMVARMIAISATSAGLMVVLCLAAVVGSGAFHALMNTRSQPLPPVQGAKRILVIEPAVVPKHTIRRGAAIKAADVYVRDIDVSTGEFFGSTNRQFVRDPQKIIGHIALDEMSQDLPIERLYVGRTEEQRQQFLKKRDWHKPGRILAARRPIKKGEFVGSADFVERSVPDVPPGALQAKELLDSSIATANLEPNQTLTWLDVQNDWLRDYDDPVPADFNTSFVHQYFLNPITKERMKYGAYSQQSFATQAISKGTVISGRNVGRRYIPVKLSNTGYPDASYRDPEYFNFFVGELAKRDIAAKEVLSRDAITGYQANQSFETPNAITQFFLRMHTYTYLYTYQLQYLVVPIVCGIIWCLLYVRLCLSSTVICLSGKGIFSGIKQSWQLSSGKTLATSLYLLKFCMVYWLIPASLGGLSHVVGIFESVNPAERNWSLALSALAHFLSPISGMVFGIITVPLYFQLLERAERIAATPGSPVKPSKTVTLGCGTLHGKSEEDPIPLDISTTAEADVMGVSKPLTHT
jgi:flagella basal body P-ring formation protein FlgA